MRELSDFAAADLRAVKAVFFDIDDTFSGGGGQHRILPEAYDALWRLQKAGIKTVPVTGRPAGWCDMITRMWPVTAVVGENGAFYSYLSQSGEGEKAPHATKLIKKYLESPAVRAANRRKLKSLEKSVQKAFPGAKTPSDQAFREFDLAIDYCEDVRRWPDARVQKLLEFCRGRGATAKLSSIHVNTWYGKYDKLACVRRMMSTLFEVEDSHIVYIGDSPNDEPFFERMPLTVGVANVRQFLARMKHAPAYVTPSSGGIGFSEFAERLLKSRS